MSQEAVCVVRISLQRALNAFVACGSEIAFVIILTTEFHEVFRNIIAECSFALRMIGDNCVHENILIDGYGAKEDRLVVRLQVPAIVGAYQLRIDCTHHDSKYIVVPLLTDCFSIVSDNKLPYGKLLSVYRPLCYKDSQYLIKESFGETLGSHLWDCAIVTLRHFDALLEFIPRHAEIVELGCGCGLTGIALAKSGKCRKVWLTDKSYQLSYIHTNIALNNATDATACSLDWECNEDINRIKEQLLHGVADVIVAADVLYDSKAVSLLFNVIQQLSHTATIIIIAQKIRGDDPEGSVKVSKLKEYKHTVIAEEANVLLHILSQRSD